MEVVLVFSTNCQQESKQVNFPKSQTAPSMQHRVQIFYGGEFFILHLGNRFSFCSQQSVESTSCRCSCCKETWEQLHCHIELHFICMYVILQVFSQEKEEEWEHEGREAVIPFWHSLHPWRFAERGSHSLPFLPLTNLVLAKRPHTLPVT